MRHCVIKVGSRVLRRAQCMQHGLANGTLASTEHGLGSSVAGSDGHRLQYTYCVKRQYQCAIAQACFDAKTAKHRSYPDGADVRVSQGEACERMLCLATSAPPARKHFNLGFVRRHHGWLVCSLRLTSGYKGRSSNTRVLPESTSAQSNKAAVKHTFGQPGQRASSPAPRPLHTPYEHAAMDSLLVCVATVQTDSEDG